uniref:Uncharacterized protein n=1 Tax=Anguilla anguilla TaxID=7936 RepID=A0A0E9T3P8_ANGAN
MARQQDRERKAVKRDNDSKYKSKRAIIVFHQFTQESKCYLSREEKYN